MSTTEKRSTRAIYLATLQKDLLSPLAKESDEEEGAGKEEEDEKEENGKTVETIAIDFEGLNKRIISLPVEAGNLFSLQVAMKDRFTICKRLQTQEVQEKKGQNCTYMILRSGKIKPS